METSIGRRMRKGTSTDCPLEAKLSSSANNRRARFDTLTTAGKKQLGVEESRFSRMFGAIMRVMKTT